MAIVCVAEDPTKWRQCQYVSYSAHEEAARKGIPTHVHRDHKGRWVSTNYGPDSACEFVPKEGE